MDHWCLFQGSLETSYEGLGNIVLEGLDHLARVLFFVSHLFLQVFYLTQKSIPIFKQGQGLLSFLGVEMLDLLVQSNESIDLHLKTIHPFVKVCDPFVLLVLINLSILCPIINHASQSKCLTQQLQ